MEKEKKGRPHKTLFWHDGGYQSVMAGDWKLQVIEQKNKSWLFNLKEDPTEQVNLADTRPEKVAALQSLLASFNKNDRVKPIWPSLIEAPIRIDRTINQPWGKNDEYVLWSN